MVTLHTVTQMHTHVSIGSHLSAYDACAVGGCCTDGSDVNFLVVILSSRQCKMLIMGEAGERTSLDIF